MAALVLAFRTAMYALNIYIYGTNRLTARDGFSGIPAEYYAPVEQYARKNFTEAQLQNAIAMTFINDQEYSETMAYPAA
jgi:hypothetical protein